MRKRPTAPKRIIFDTDIGLDDALALLFALCSPELALEGVTTVFGNAAVDDCTRNALAVLALGGRPAAPVARGADHPLLQAYSGPRVAVHGGNGLGDIALPPPQARPLDVTAAQFIARQIMLAPGEVNLVAVGPLTNLALALRLEPRIARAVRQVIVMGGAVTVGGSVTAVAETNIYADPEAASIVLAAGWPLTLVGLDVTTQVRMDERHLARLAAARTPLTDFAVAIAAFYSQSHARRYGGGGFFVHDPSAVAYAVDPTLFETRRLHVAVDTTGGPGRGRTVADLCSRAAQGLKTDVCLGVDAPRLLALLLDRLTKCQKDLSTGYFNSQLEPVVNSR